LTIPVCAPRLEENTVAVKVTVLFTRIGFALEVSAVEVAAGFTTSASAADVLPVKFRSPAYVTVIECEPRAKFPTEIWAPLFERKAVPTELDPSKNVTVPVARVPLTEGTTVAVNVTVWPNEAGFRFVPTVMDELAGLTVSVNALEVLAV
jgi:hypothetical protein